MLTNATILDPLKNSCFNLGALFTNFLTLNIGHLYSTASTSRFHVKIFKTPFSSYEKYALKWES